MNSDGSRTQFNNVPNKNRQPKIQFKEDYDFEQANNEFEEIRSKLDKMNFGPDDKKSSIKLKKAVDGDGDGSSGVVDGDDGWDVNANGNDDRDSHEGLVNGENDAEPQADVNVNAETKDSTVYYDKCKSFFDNISCSEMESNKKIDWNKERKLNSETFGFNVNRRFRE